MKFTRAHPETGTVRVHAILSNPDKLLLPGMFTHVRMFFGEPQVLLEVPDKTVIEHDGIAYVLALTGDNRVEKRSIKWGMFEGRMLVEEGLRPDDRVVISSTQRLQVGERVEPERVK